MIVVVVVVVVVNGHGSGSRNQVEKNLEQTEIIQINHNHVINLTHMIVVDFRLLSLEPQPRPLTATATIRALTSFIPSSCECFLSFSLCFIYLTTIFLSYHYCFKRDSYHLQRGFQLLSPISSPSHSVLPVLPHFEPFPLVLYIFTTPPTLSHSSPLVFGLFLLYFNAYYLFFIFFIPILTFLLHSFRTYFCSLYNTF